MAEKVRIVDVRGHVTMVHTRIPFRYGAATLVHSPHLLLEAEVEVGGVRAVGMAADTLPPGWFDKSPGKPYERQVREQIQVIRWALEAAGETAGTAFAVWRDAEAEVARRARSAGLPALLAGFGASFVERLLWDALGRASGLSFADLVRANAFGVDLGALDPALAGADPAQSLAEGGPLAHVWARHTVGLADPITDAEIPAAERVDDGLPQSLEACLRHYGLRYLKVKLCNDRERDLARLRAIAAAVERYEAQGGGPVMYTLDGNEQYRHVDELADLLDAMEKDPALRALGERVVYIEQPLQRDVALDAARLAGLERVRRRHPMIIDESDADFDAYKTALALGYDGTSHKNCKGIIRSLAAAARNRRHRASTGRPAFLSGEDLASIGPVSMLQDLAVAAALGIAHVERNGHHYFRGLSHLAPADAEAVAAVHSDLYERRGGIVTLKIEDGRMACASLHGPGLGARHRPAVETWQPWLEFDPAALSA